MSSQLLLVSLVSLLIVLCPDKGFADNNRSEVFKSQLGFVSTLSVDVGGHNRVLSLVGESERSFLFFDIYNIGYYAERFSNKEESIIEVLYLIYERDLGKEKVHAALKKGIEKNLKEGQFEEVSDDFENLLEGINSDVREGDTLEILKDRNGILTFLYNKKKVYSISKALLAGALWDIWMGDHSVVDRESLLKGSR